MKDKKNFHWIVLILILFLLVVSSLVSRMAHQGTSKEEGTFGTQSATEEAGEQNDEAEVSIPEASEDNEARVGDETQEPGEYSEEYDEALREAGRKREEDERYVSYRRKLAEESRKNTKKESDSESCSAGEEEEAEEEIYTPPTILIVSDLHYMSALTHDAGDAFISMMLEDDGKLSHCSDMILEALIDEAIERGVSAVVMAGDNTLNGERINHEELAERLKRLTDAGIALLLVPGNHDINNTNAAVYFGDEAEETEYLHSADEYYEIYEDFYEGANSRDPNSLSYVYPLDETHWIMLLDSAWYEDRMHVDGRIREGTLLWMEEVFEAAEEAGALVIPVAHHNLLSESRVFTKECIMRNYDEVLELLEAHHLPLYLSGHLHVQRIKKHKTQPGVSDDEYGITEIVSSPVSIAPCQYGILSWDDDDNMHYEVYALTDHMDEDGDHIEELTDAEVNSEDVIDSVSQDETDVVPEDEETETETFRARADEFTKAVISNQIKSHFPSIPEDVKDELGSLYADIYYLYVSGSYIDWDEVTATEAFALWQKYSQTNELIDEMRGMAQDNTEDYHEWEEYRSP